MYAAYLLKKHLTIVVTMGALFLWAATASSVALMKSAKTILIGIDANGTRVIESHDDPLFKTELVNFTRRFFSLLYNFDAETFEANVGSASDLMSTALWTKERDKLSKLASQVKSEKISYSGVLKSISRLKDDKFQVVIRTSEMRRLKSEEQDLVVTLTIKPATRTVQNPWGMEVETLEESKL